MKAIRKEDGTWCTVDDDSDILQHYGVMGMKWGVRNAETLARYAGATRKQIRTENKINKREQKLFTATQNMTVEAMQRGKAKNRTIRKRDRAAEKYLKTTKDPAYKKYKKRMNIAAISGGAIGGAIAFSTKRGRQVLNDYQKRLDEVTLNAVIHTVGAAKGREAMDEALKRFRKNKPLGEGIY